MSNERSHHLWLQHRSAGDPLQYSQEYMWWYFQRILEAGNKTTTYKFALARFLYRNV